ncbi:MAG: OmpA family protein [Terriglobia bacterium]
MSRKKKAPEHVNHERWLISYGDFITLLFALFVVLFASSQVDKRKTVAVAQAIQIAFQQLGVFPAGHGTQALERIRLLANSNPPAANPSPAERPNILRGAEYRTGEFKQLRAELMTVLASEISHRDVNIRTTRDGLVVSLQEVGFFDSGSAVMKPNALPVLRKIADTLSGAPQNIRVEGHTDNVPIHNSQFASNWDLSTARATEVLNLLITRFGIAPSRLSAAGYAKYHPVASNATASGRARNRRVDIVVLRTDISNPPPIQGRPEPPAAAAGSSAVPAEP